MSEYTIGIKTGDGKFYAILEESFKGKKRFVLTTVNDDQTSVQIDFYRSKGNAIESSEYIGSLVIENIEPAPKKVPEIEVILGIDEKKSLHAVARNLSSQDDKQSLTVSLESLTAGLTYDIPEFELDDKLQPTTLFEDDQEIEDNSITGESYHLEEEDRRKKHLNKEKPNPLMIFLLVVAALLVLAAISFGIMSLINILNKSNKPPIDISQTGSTVVAAVATVQKTEAPVVAKATETKKPVQAAVATEGPKKKEIHGGGYWYTIQKGDTLWDISQSVYDSPWSYWKIYTTNKKIIKNPNLIFCEQKIYLPKL